MEPATTPVDTMEEDTDVDLSKLLPDNLAPIDDCLAQLRLADDGDWDLRKSVTAMDLSVVLRRAESFMEDIRNRIRGEANKQFADLQAVEPNKKQWAVCDGLGVIKSTTPKANWKYPAFIGRLESDLKGQKKAAQEDGTATKAEPTIDPQSSTMFTITLSEKFGQ